MKIRNLTLLAGLLLAALAVGSAFGATTIVSDNYSVTTTTTGFALDNGVNFGINPPTTRITGSAKANLRYLQTATTRTASKYGINSSRLRVQTENSIGRFTLSANGSTPFDFSPALGALYATPANPATYDVKISMRNDATTAARLSFGLATAEGDVTTFDFGAQIYRATTADNFYTIQKRIDSLSSGVSDVNLVMANAEATTWQTMMGFLIRVTDAGPESGANYNSRIQVSTNNGASFIYDTATDPALPNGFRFDGAGRYIIFDQAANVSDNVFYDSFSISSTFAPSPPAGRVWTGGSTEDNNWSSADNWGGGVPISGEPLVFNGTTRQVNTNDFPDFTALSVTFSNGGFALYGNVFTNILGVSNLAGINILGADMAWGISSPRNWSLASGSELVLSNTVTVEVSGDHSVSGGGILHQYGAVNIGQAPGSAASPVFSVDEGMHIIDGSSFTSKGSYRVGSIATAAVAGQAVLTNNALLYVTAAGGSVRVGNSVSPLTSRLVLDNSTFKTDGTPLCIPYAVGATGEVVQVGGLVQCPINFCQLGTNQGTYTITNGTLETRCITNNGNDGNGRINFENAVVRAPAGAYSAFMSGLDTAEIYAGGLSLDAQTDIVIAQPLVGVGGLTNIGPATVTLNGANTYSGATVINAGKLVLPTGKTYKGTIQVADSQAAPIALEVLLKAAGGSLKNGTLSLGAGNGGIATLNFDLGAFSNPTGPLMYATNLSANSVVTINLANGFHLSRGQFVLIDYQGAIGNLGYDAFVLGSLPGGLTAELVNNTANSSIDLLITGSPGLLWTGDISSDWDTSTQNWEDEFTSLPSTYSDYMLVDFLDGATTGFVNLTITPTCTAITVSNDTLPYVWNGGRIITDLVKKNGAGSVTRVGGEFDTITTIELNAGSYVFSNDTDVAFTPVLKDTTAGTGTFVKRGVGTLTMSAGNANDTYKGKTVIQEGIVKLGDTRALGDETATVIITNGGTLELDDHQPVQPVIVSGGGVGGQGAIVDSTTGTGVEYNLRDVTMTGDTTLGCPVGRWDLRANGGHGPGPGLRGNGFKLTKMGAGHVSIANQRTTTGYWQMNLGDVIIKEGQLSFAESLTPGNPSAGLAIYPGASLNLYDLGITNPLVRNITATNAFFQCAGNASDTNIINGSILMSGDCRFWANQAHFIINAPISGDGAIGFYAADPGTLLLNGLNTYTGDTTVTNGTFGGTGVLAGNLVMLGGTNAPGADGVGTLTVNGNVTLAGTTRMELNRSRSPNSDRIVVGGTLEFGGTLQVTLGAGAPALQAGDVYQLFSKGSSSAFAAVSLPAGLPAGSEWDTTKLASDGVIKVTGSAPTTIGLVEVNGDTFTLSGTGGTEGGSYRVVSSSDVAASLPAWVTVENNVFGPGGTFTFTTNIVSGGPKAFFRVVAP